MRFARLQCETDAAPGGLEELAAAGELDFIQLDYPRPRTVAVESSGDVELPDFAPGFPQAIAALVKPLFLDPQLRAVTSAGWADAYGTAEQAARVLVEGGCGDVPVSAVRGSNLLPILEMLVADRVDLKNAVTGASWREMRQPLLAADLHLGAGPFVTAFAEGARVIVAGCFDAASPATAAAVAEHGWSWNDYPRLAAAALAAHAATWCDWQAASDWPLTPAWGELDNEGRFHITTPEADAAAAERLQHWLRSTAGDARFPRADVSLGASAACCVSNGRRQLVVDGAAGTAGDDRWLLEIRYQNGYSTEAMIEFKPKTEGRARRRLAETARTHLPVTDDPSGHLTVELLEPLGDSGVGWLHVAFRSNSRKACQYVAEQTLRLTAAHRSLARLAPGMLGVRVHCGLWPARVPRAAIDIAVETRLAKEWI